MEQKQLPPLDSNQSATNDARPWGMDVNSYTMLMHLGQFAGLIIPLGGWILPIVMWATNKDDHKEVDEHGKNILNWLISVTIYAIICGVLSIIFIGIIGLIILGLLTLIFTTIGAVKAYEGNTWEYPLAIRFIK